MEQKKNKMIVVTGAAGFIGSCMAAGLNQQGYENLILVDDFSIPAKEANHSGKDCKRRIDRNKFINWLNKNIRDVDFIIHFGARTDTTEFNTAIFDELNLNYSKSIWEIAAGAGVPLLYASSAATYGMGELGYKDDHGIVKDLEPLNPYGRSKNDFDRWVLEQKEQPPFWAGLKFFNVYGPNEYHKGRMASVIFHAHEQIRKNGFVKLFRSHHPEYRDGEQLRDFIYVKDVVKVSLWLMENRPASGIYNLGTGTARTFLDLARSTFRAMGLKEEIEFIDTPEDIRDKYQYFTEARMEKLRNAGYEGPFLSLEDGVGDYVRNYLSVRRYL